MKIITTVASLTGQTAKHWKMCADLEPVTHISVENDSCVAAARNRCLTAAYRAPGWDVCLMIDDDVTMTKDDWICLCKQAHQTGEAVAAVYPTASGRVHLQFAQDPRDARRQLVLTGLGALAIPRRALEVLAGCSKVVLSGEHKEIIAFTKSDVAPDNLHWWNEDAWLCYRLGGVRISPTRATHWKLKGLQLSPEALEDVEAFIDAKVSCDPAVWGPEG